LKRYVRASGEITLSNSELNSLISEAIEEFTSYVKDVASDYNFKYEIKFDVQYTELEFDDEDSVQYKVVLKDNHDNHDKYFDLYVDLILVDGEWMLASDMYDHTDDYYEQAHMYLDKYFN
jgi:hypothetical protein